MTDRRPRCIVITGASAGIGQALAHAYAEPGVTLGLAARDAARLEACAEQCRQAGATVVTAQVDVRNADAVAAWLTAFDDAHPIDLLIANAGVASTLSSSSDWEDLARTREVFDTNFYGAFHTLLPVLERLRARKRGHVVVVSSLAAHPWHGHLAGLLRKQVGNQGLWRVGAAVAGSRWGAPVAGLPRLRQDGDERCLSG